MRFRLILTRKPSSEPTQHMGFLTKLFLLAFARQKQDQPLYPTRATPSVEIQNLAEKRQLAQKLVNSYHKYL